MSRVVHRRFSSSLRFYTRVHLNAPARSLNAALTRRLMSSGSHAGHGGSGTNDLPWIIGSALTFGPLFLYLVSPSARRASGGHHGHEGHPDKHEDNRAQHVQSHQDISPIADDEGTEVSEQEVKESMEKAFEADSPKEAQEREDAIVRVAEEGSATETQPQAEPLADATLAPEPELNPTLSAPIKVDEATNVTGDENV